MLTKVSVLPIVRDHFSTLRDVRTEQPHWPDYAVQVGAPAVVGVVAALMGVHLQEIGSIIGGLAVLAGFTFGLLIFVFQLRMQAASDPRVGGTHRLLDLIDELFANVAYALVVAFASTVIAMAVTGFSLPHWMSPWTDGLLLALILHFVLTMAMCTKRTYLAYQRVRT